MRESAARVWKKVGLFYALTLLFSAPFEVAYFRAPGNITLVTGVMWGPALAAFVVKWVFRERVRDLGWHWGRHSYHGWAYLIPILYALPVYLVVWMTGLGGFYDIAFVEKTAKDYGLSGMSPAAVLTTYILLSMTAGFILKTARALGEEIGWRGFLVPELAKVTGFTGVGLISGLMWAIWHYPAILFSDYNAGTPAWYGLTCFTVGTVAAGVIAAWLCLRSGSVWPAVWFHGSHNMFVQLVFTPLTTDTGRTAYLIDEFGAGIAITSLIGAVIVWRRRGELPSTAMAGDGVVRSDG